MASAAEVVWNAGTHVVVEAVPGAGKSTLLLELARRRPSLLLAYNQEIARELTQATGSECRTFHGLCSVCIAPVHDDVQLRDAVNVARARPDTVHWDRVPRVEQVLIDEAQDVRGIYVEMLRVLGLLHSAAAVFVVGDRHQLVYDFDPEFPASLDVLTRPQHAVLAGVAWKQVVIRKTHRLLDTTTDFVNAVFGTALKSARPSATGPSVQVRCPRSAFALKEALDELMQAHPSLLLLAHRRRGNRPLRDLLNAWSRDGVSIYCPGVDAPPPSSDAACPPRVRCCSYWGAKGLQHETVVVLVPGRVAFNPLYVALTRASERMVILLEPNDPHAAICAAAHATGTCFSDAFTARAVAAGRGKDVALSLSAPAHATPSPTADAAAVHVHCLADPLCPDFACAPAPCTSVAVLTAMALLWTELKHTGRVRGIDAIYGPCRMDRQQFREAVQLGYVGRHVPRMQSDAMILSDDLRAVTTRAYALCRAHAAPHAAPWDSVYTLAHAVAACDGFDHTMRQCPPFSDDAPAVVGHRAAWLLAQIPADAQFDVHVPERDGFPVNVHAWCALRCYHVTWDATSADRSTAAARAHLHPGRECHLISLAPMQTQRFACP